MKPIIARSFPKMSVYGKAAMFLASSFLASTNRIRCSPFIENGKVQMYETRLVGDLRNREHHERPSSPFSAILRAKVIVRFAGSGHSVAAR